VTGTADSAKRSQGGAEDPHEALCPRQRVSYTCQRGHAFEVVFAASATAPAAWDCRCGKPAGLCDQSAAEPELQRRMTQVRQRRNEAELEQLIADRIARRN